jgi:hypothetical protein
MRRHSAFEFFLHSVRPVLAREHGEERVDPILADARLEYERVLPEVPDIGGRRNVFQGVMTVNGWIAAFHRAMAAHGFSAADSIRIGQQVLDGWLQRLPRFVLRAIGRILLSAPSRRYFERQALRSQDRRYAEDFVWKLEYGAAGEVSFVFDECAVNKWYDAQGLTALKPYCNFVDVTYSRLMGMGIDAHETIGTGCEKCALRVQHGRETVVPKNLKGIIADV